MSGAADAKARAPYWHSGFIEVMRDDGDYVLINIDAILLVEPIDPGNRCRLHFPQPLTFVDTVATYAEVLAAITVSRAPETAS